MNPYAEIEQRYGVSIPDSYRDLHSQGYLSNADSPSSFKFYDFTWLSLNEIATYEFNPCDIESDGGFVPFAVNRRQEPYFWRYDWAIDHAEPPVVFCHQFEIGTGIAANFQSLLFRLAIEAFAGNNELVNLSPRDDMVEGMHAITGDTLTILDSALLPAQMTTLRRLHAKPLQYFHDRTVWGTISWAEACAIIRSEMPFEHLDKDFIRDKEFMQRESGEKQ